MSNAKTLNAEAAVVEQSANEQEAVTGGELQVEEFSIVELEDRLEFLDCCDPNCQCPA